MLLNGKSQWGPFLFRASIESIDQMDTELVIATNWSYVFNIKQYIMWRVWRVAGAIDIITPGLETVFADPIYTVVVT